MKSAFSRTGILFCTLLICALGWTSTAHAQQTADVTAVVAGALFDGQHETLQENVVILIQDGMITEVGSNVEIPAGAEEIDLSDWTVLPGLIDLHTHLTNSPAQISRPPGSGFYQDYPESPALRGVRHAHTTLMTGFTTVRDLGASGSTALALRDAISDGIVSGPRMFTAVSMGTTGSHCDPTTGIKPGHMDRAEASPYVFNGPQEAKQMVRQAVRDGADLIKVCATAGVLSQTEEIGPAQMTSEELEAIIQTAEMYDRRVAAHAHGLEGIRNAVRAGITTIDHGSEFDDEIIQEMIDRGTWLVPTMLAYQGALQMAEAGNLAPGPTQKIKEIMPIVEESHRRAIAAGVRIAFGTDAGVYEHGDNIGEFELMVDAGMTPVEALIAATGDAARALGRDDVGAIAGGRLADLIAVQGNPLDDVSVLHDIGFIMKDGVIYKKDGEEMR